MSTKKNLSEENAALLNIRLFIKDGHENWPTISEMLLAWWPEAKPVLAAPGTTFEWTMAVLALQSHSLPNQFPAEQVNRLRAHSRRLLASVPDIGDISLDAFNAYFSAATRPLDRSLGTLLVPFGSVTVEWCKRVGLPGAVPNGPGAPRVLFLQSAHSSLLISAGSFWQDVGAKYQLVA